MSEPSNLVNKINKLLLIPSLLTFAVLILSVYLVQRPKNILTGLGAIPGDVNSDGVVDIIDFQLLSNSFGKSSGQSGFNANADFNQDNVVDILDFQVLSNNFGHTGATGTITPRPTGTTATVTPRPSITTSPTPTVPVGNCSSTSVRCVPQEYSTIQAAIDASVANDTVLVSNGTYSGFVVNKIITVQAATYNQNDPSQNTVIVNSQVSSSGGSSWAWNQGPVVRGFKISGSYSVVMNNSPMTLEYNYVSGPSDNVSFEGGGGIVRGNRLTNAGDDDIDIDNQSKNILIENNYLLNAGEEGIEMRQQNSTISQRLDVIIRGNRFENNPSDGFQIMDYNNFSNRRYIIDHNVFIGNKKGGIAIMPADITKEDLSAAAMPEPMYVTNNTFVNNYAAIAGGANAVLINNIFSGSTGFDLKNVNGLSEIKYNMFAVTPKLQGTNNLDSGTTYIANPLLTSSYTLQSGSPAIDKGIAQYTHTYHYDGSGGGSAQNYTDTVINLSSSQYNGSAPDLGWKEF